MDTTITANTAMADFANTEPTDSGPGSGGRGPLPRHPFAIEV